MARSRRGAEAPPLRPAQAHHQAVARQLPGLQGRHLSRRSSCTRSSPTWPASASPPASPARSSASARSRPCSTRTTRPAPPATSASTRRRPTAGRPTPRRCHINWVILDSDWEAEFCRVAESHPRVRAYVKNHNLGFEVPYRYGSETRTYLPDFIVLVDDGHGDDDLLHLVVEIKGYRREDAKEKKSTMETYWVPGVNNLGTLRPLGLRRVHRRLRDRGRLQGQGRRRIQHDDRLPPAQRRGAEGADHGQENEPTARPSRRSRTTRRKRQEHPDGGVPVCHRRRSTRAPGPRRLRAPQPRPRPAARLARQGRAGLVATSSSMRRRSTSRRRSTRRF